MSTLVIFEGCDNSGKTTAAKAVAEHLGYKYQHGGAAVAHTRDVYADQLGMLGQAVVLDRTRLISHPIYECVLNGLDETELHRSAVLVESLLVTNNIVLVMCMPPKSLVLDMSTHIVKAHDTEAHVQQVQRHKAALYEAYKDLNLHLQAIENPIMGSQPAFLTFDYTRASLDSLKEAVELMVTANE